MVFLPRYLHNLGGKRGWGFIYRRSITTYLMLFTMHLATSKDMIMG